jgi:hypothetical protein
MKNLILSAVFAVVAFTSNAQLKIINVYEVITFNKDTLTTTPYDVIKNPSNISDTLSISKRFIINFSNNTFIEYVNGENVSNGTVEVIRELVGDGFKVLLKDSSNLIRGIDSYLAFCYYFSQTENKTSVEYYESFSIY